MPNCKLWLNENGELVMEDGKIAFSEDCPCGGHGGSECFSDLLRFVARKASRIACPTVPEAGFPLVEMDLESIIVSVCGYEITVPNSLEPPTCGDGETADDCSCLIITKMICPWMGNAETDPPETLVPHLYPVIPAPDYPSIFPTELEKCLQTNWRSCFSPIPIGYVYAAVQVIAPRCWFDDGDVNDKTLVWGVVGCFCEMGESGNPSADLQYRKFCGGSSGPGAIVVDAAFLPEYITVPNTGPNAVGTHQEMVCDITCKGHQQLIQEMVKHYSNHGQVAGIYISVDPDEWRDLTGEEPDPNDDCFFKVLRIGCGWYICCEGLDPYGQLSMRTKSYVFDCDCVLHVVDETTYWDSQANCSSLRKTRSSPIYLHHQEYQPPNTKASTDTPGEQTEEVDCLEDINYPNFCDGTCPALDLLQTICSKQNGIDGNVFTGSPTVNSLLWYDPSARQSYSVCPSGSYCIPHASNAGAGGVIVTEDSRESNIYSIGCAENEKCLFACWNDDLGLLLWVDCTCTLRKACTKVTKKKFVSCPSSCLCLDWRNVVEENQATFGVVDSTWGSHKDVEMNWTVNGQTSGFRGSYWTFGGDEIPFNDSCDECDEEADHVTGYDVWGGFVDYEMFIIKRVVGNDTEMGHLEKDGSFRNLRIESLGGSGVLVGSNSRITGWIPWICCMCDQDPDGPSGVFGCGDTGHASSDICDDGGGYNGWWFEGVSFNCYALHGTSIIWCMCTSYPEYNPADDDYLCEYKNRTLSPDTIYFDANYWYCLSPPNFASKRFKIPGHEEDSKCDPSYARCHWEPPSGGIKSFAVQFIETSCGLYMNAPGINFLEGITIPGTSTLTVSLGGDISDHFGYFDPTNTVITGPWPSNDTVISGNYIDESQSVRVGPDNVLFDFVRMGGTRTNQQRPPCRGNLHCPAGHVRYSNFNAYCNAANPYACQTDWTDPDAPVAV